MISLLGDRRDGSEECGSLMLVACHPHVAAVNHGHTLGDREPDSSAGGAVGVSGRPVIAVENSLTVGDGDDRTVAVYREDGFRISNKDADRDRGAEDGVLACVVNV
jgi:hypothetical protein